MKNPKAFLAGLLLACSAAAVAAHANYSTSAGGPASSAKPRLGDRVFIDSVLRKVFGENASEETLRYIVRAESAMGGACDFYAQVRHPREPARLQDPRSECFTGKMGMTVPMVGNANVIREAYISKACESLTSGPETLKHAMKQIFGGEEAPAIGADGVLKAYQAFNPERELPAPVTESLIKVAKSGDGDSLTDSWRRVILTVCLDPGWQIL